MSLNIEPSKRRKLSIGVSAFALTALIVIGVFASNGWFPRTDAVSGKKTGWFGQSEPPAVAGGLTSQSGTLPSGTPQLSKEYIYAGSRLLAVEDANANAAPPADLAVWRPSSGVWWVMGGAAGSQPAVQGWGINGDIPAQGDFDGDGKTDFSIFRPSSGEWWILKSSDGTYYSQQFGISTDNLAQADYDGDGRTDVAVWRASDGVWYIISSSTGGVQYAQYGTAGDKPAPADYDGDGRADIAVWRDSNHNFYSINSSNSQYVSSNFATSVTLPTSSTPVSGDYDGDGRADYAVRNANNWIIRNSSSSALQTVAWQLATDKSVQNDYDGDGKVDIAVWRNTDSYYQAGDAGMWFIRQSATNNSLRQVQWGMHDDIPVPAFYRR
ncbi:MAG: FG-GAP repeat domain-containing protein [Pyrinomonadaceae bacterium]